MMRFLVDGATLARYLVCMTDTKTPTETEMKIKVLRLEEAAAALGVSLRTLDRLVDKHGVQKIRVGWRDVGISREGLEKLLKVKEDRREEA